MNVILDHAPADMGYLKVFVVGGDAHYLYNFRGPLLKALLDKGCSVVAAAPWAPPHIQEGLMALGAEYRHVPVERAGLNPARDIAALLAFLRLFRRERPFLVLAYTIKPIIWGLLAARLARVPQRVAMITGLGYAFMEGDGLRQRLVHRVVCFLYRRALVGVRAVLFQNPDDRAEFERRGLLSKGTAVVMINGSGVDVQHYVVAPLPNTPVFLLMARLIGDKGVREYVAAAKELRARHPQARFLLAGALDTNPTAIKDCELQQWQRDGDVEYLGSLDDVRPALAQCRVYVLPSYREGTPRSVLEAMSAGRAVVTTDAPGCRETVQDGVNGFLVPVRDAIALATAMERFILEPDLAESMGHAARRITEEKFDVHAVNSVIMHGIGLASVAEGVTQPSAGEGGPLP